LSPVDTLRVSVTDRCNLQCAYCVPRGRIPRIAESRLLGWDEILRVVRAGASVGIRKVRISGGEPLVRRGLPGFIASLREVPGIADLCLTTNGVLLAGLAGRLKQAGLDRVTVSLDSLRRDRYERIAGFDALGQVREGLAAAVETGLTPLKINVVVIRGANEDEVVDFARLSIHQPLEVRFIERMPLGPGRREESRGCGLWEREGVSGEWVRERIEAALGPLEPAPPAVPLPGPARLFRVPGSPGRFGLITPMTHPFCGACTRLRLTPDGRLRSCLFGSDELDAARALRSGQGAEELRALFERAIRAKRRGPERDFAQNRRWMAEIGG